MDILKLLQKIPGCPPLFREEIMDKFGAKGVLLPGSNFPARRFYDVFPIYRACQMELSRVEMGVALFLTGERV
jgi:hypothetical protein